MTNEPTEQAHPLDLIIINQSNRIDELEAELALFRQSASAQLMAKVVSAHQNKIEELTAELARYEAMINEAGGFTFKGRDHLQHDEDNGWYLWPPVNGDPRYWDNPLDAYDALKEVTQ